jgi:hypothetical protein
MEYQQAYHVQHFRFSAIIDESLQPDAYICMVTCCKRSLIALIVLKPMKANPLEFTTVIGIYCGHVYFRFISETCAFDALRRSVFSMHY